MGFSHYLDEDRWVLYLTNSQRYSAFVLYLSHEKNKYITRFFKYFFQHGYWNKIQLMDKGFLDHRSKTNLNFQHCIVALILYGIFPELYCDVLPAQSLDSGQTLKSNFLLLLSLPLYFSFSPPVNCLLWNSYILAKTKDIDLKTIRIWS